MRTVIPIVFAVVATVLHGDTEQPNVKLGPHAPRDLAVGPEMVATGAILRDSEFVGQDLRMAEFDRTDLAAVRFHQCNLSRSSFVGARLTGAIIDDCDLESCNFTDAIVNGLVPAGRTSDHECLSVAQLKSTRSYRSKDLSNCSILGSENSQEPCGYDFRNANLTNANLLRGDFTSCKFANARIQGARIGGRITAHQLASTDDYTKRWLQNIRFVGQIDGLVNFKGIRFLGCTFGVRNQYQFDHAWFEKCNFHGSIDGKQLLVSRNYKQGNLSGMRFSEIDFSDFDFSRINLTDCAFTNCDFHDAQMNDAVITGISFIQCKGLTREQIKTTWNFKQDRLDGILLPRFPSSSQKQKDGLLSY